MAITQTITTLPTAPSTTDASTFRARGDAFLTALNTFDDEMNLVISQANALETNVNTKEASATYSALACTASANFQGTWTNQTTVIGQSWHYQGDIYRVLVAGNTSPIASPNNWVKLWINQNRRNYLINGNFYMWQRGTTVTGPLDTFNFAADRFFDYHSGTSATTTLSQQSHIIGEPLSNSKYFIRSVVVGGTSADANSSLIQRIENVRTTAGKTITLSFLAKADTDKKLGVSFSQNFGTGGTPSASVATSSILNITNTWAKYTVTVTMPSISGKTLGTNNNDLLQVSFGMSNNTPTSPFYPIGIQSGTFDISDIKIEDGSVATDGWHPYDGEFGGEIQACQEYAFNPKYGKDIANQVVGTAYADTTTTGYIIFDLPHSHRQWTALSFLGGAIASNLYLGYPGSIALASLVLVIIGDRAVYAFTTAGHVANKTYQLYIPNATHGLIFSSEL